MSRSRHSPGSLLLPLVFAFLGTSCPPTSTAPDAAHDANEIATSEEMRRVLSQVAERVMLASLRRLATDLAALEASTATLATDPSEANRAAARESLVRAMDEAQRADVFQVGPAAPLGTTPEGAGVRDEYQPWPLVSSCRVDQETVESAHETEDALAAEGLNVRGLASIEYLLFAPAADNSCSPTTSINTDGSWAALGETGIAMRRARYAHTATTLARRQVDGLVATWEGGYLERLRTAGAGSPTYPTAHDGLNAVSDALFYVYEPLLDLKLGTPAGMYECYVDSCPERVESPWRDVAATPGTEGGSLRAIRVNLEAFRDAYLGHDGAEDGPGFDDLLRFLGASDLDTRMQAAITAALTAVAAIEGPLSVAVVERPEQVVAAVEAVDALTTLLKTEFITVLDLELPMRAEGDND